MEIGLPALQPGPMTLQPIGPAPCTRACPARVNVKAYVSLIAMGRLDAALEVVRERCPLPSVCGRVCHHPCEAVCELAAFGQPIAIRALKRFVADQPNLAPAPTPRAERPEQVAVVGSGPAGLTAAYDLRLAGYPVTVLEMMPEPGGMLRYGIADYRLPPDVLDAEIEVLRQTGIRILTWMRFESPGDIQGLLDRDYRAVLLAVGSQRGRRLGIPGEDKTGDVEDALTFLRRVNQGDRTQLGGKVVVIGGGSTAVEAARAAVRLGAREVEIVYRRSRRELLASEEEVGAAEAEGVAFRFLAAPHRVVYGNKSLQGLECLQVTLGAPDASGRRRPVPRKGSEFYVEADRVFAAVGQEADLAFLPTSRSMVEEGRLVADPVTAATPWPGVFAAGDVVTGPATVIEAIAAGHRAAEAMAAYLETDAWGAVAPSRPAEEYGLPDPPPVPSTRISPQLTLPRPGREFSEVEQPYSAAEAMTEADRCLRCGPCSECVVCAPGCGRRHLFLQPTAQDPGLDSPLLVRAPASVAVSLSGPSTSSGRLRPDGPTGGEHRVGVQPMLVDYIEARCRGCSLCLDVCQFDALSLLDENDPESKVALDTARCRGCGLCTAVCPTAALTPTAHSPEWWNSLLDQVFDAAGEGPLRQPHVVITCESRAAAVGLTPSGNGPDRQVAAVRCVGQVHPGMLLDLHRRGAREVTVDRCPLETCRFGQGAHLAEQHTADARSVLEVLGAEAQVLTCRSSVGWAGPGLVSTAAGSPSPDGHGWTAKETEEGGQ